MRCLAVVTCSTSHRALDAVEPRSSTFLTLPLSDRVPRDVAMPTTKLPSLLLCNCNFAMVLHPGGISRRSEVSPVKGPSVVTHRLRTMVYSSFCHEGREMIHVCVVLIFQYQFNSFTVKSCDIHIVCQGQFTEYFKILLGFCCCLF